MIKLKEFEPDAKSVAKIVDIFKRQELPRLERLYRYFEGKDDILHRTMESGKPNNKLVCEYCKYITKTGTGYFMGSNVQYKSDKPEYLKRYGEVISDNFEHDENYELAKQASVFGVAAELIYQNEAGRSRFKWLDPRESIFIFGTKLEIFLTGFINLYWEIDINDKKTEKAVVYTKEEMITFSRPPGTASFREDYREPHLFGEIPVAIYKNNEEMTGDFEGIISLNDGYDRAQSNTANDSDYFTDAYLLVSGAADIETDGDKLDEGSSDANKAKTLREQKMLFFPDGGDARFLTKEINDDATEHYKDRLNNDIHKFSMTPDMGDEQFAGNLSGVAIGFKTLPLEDRTVEKENKFKTGLTKRREILTAIINIRYGTNYDYREITEVFTRTLPQNVKENTETILSMAEYISRRTLLELLPQIEDVDEEIRRLEEEEENAASADYNFEEQESGAGVDGLTGETDHE